MVTKYVVVVFFCMWYAPGDPCDPELRVKQVKKMNGCYLHVIFVLYCSQSHLSILFGIYILSTLVRVKLRLKFTIGHF